MGMRMPETCWAGFKRQAINLRNCCFWLVDSFEFDCFKCLFIHFHHWHCLFTYVSIYVCMCLCNTN
jgi:hypothetical protein